MENMLEQAQWFAITVIGGKEDSIIDAINEKIRNFGFENYIGTIRIFKIQDKKEEVFAKDDNQIPANPKKTKTTEWQVLPDGRYKRIRLRVVNKFPGYVFIHMVYNRDVWFAIRNTPGVLGFVGSSGKGAMPVPITIEEYTNISDEKPIQTDVSSSGVVTQSSSSDETQPTILEKKTYTTEVKIGNTVDILEGAFAGMQGEVKMLDNTKGIAIIVIDFFGRSQEIEVSYNQFTIAL